MRNWTEKTLSQAEPVFLMCWKMRWTKTSEQHRSLQVVGSFLEKNKRKKSTAQAHVASTTPLLYPQSKNLPRRTTQRQQRQIKKEKKKEKIRGKRAQNDDHAESWPQCERDGQ